MSIIKIKSSIFIQRSCLFNIALAVILVFGLTACNKNKSGEKSSQTIVSVNSDEITIHQLNYQLQRANINVKDQDAASKQILAGLIDRQILVQEALKAQLDRNPQVMQVIEDDKQQILAKAYIEGKVATVAKPTEAEVIEYRTKNPDIFENRQLYAMEELSFAIEPILKAELENLSNTAKTLDEVITWLDGKGIKYGRNKAVHAAETLPNILLNKFAQLKLGELIFINSPSKILVGKLIETKSQPISVKDSKPIIERILVTEKQKKVAEDEMNSLRNAAKIIFLDKKYESNVGEKHTKPVPAESTSENKPEIKEDSVISKTDPLVKNKKSENHIEKGLSGL